MDLQQSCKSVPGYRNNFPLALYASSLAVQLSAMFASPSHIQLANDFTGATASPPPAGEIRVHPATFRIAALLAVQNVLFLLRIASECGLSFSLGPFLIVSCRVEGRLSFREELQPLRAASLL